jgi:hypothetical protein
VSLVTEKWELGVIRTEYKGLKANEDVDIIYSGHGEIHYRYKTGR